MGLASKLQQFSDTMAGTNTSPQYAQAQVGAAAPPPSSQYYTQQQDGYGAARMNAQSPSARPAYHAQQHDGYGAASANLQSPTARPPYYAQQQDGYGAANNPSGVPPYSAQQHDGYGAANMNPQSPSAFPAYYAQQQDGYGGPHSPSAPPFPYGSAPSQTDAQQPNGYGDGSFAQQSYPYPSHTNGQAYGSAQSYPYSGTPTPKPQAGFDRQQTSAASPYPAYPGYQQPPSDGRSNFPYEDPYPQRPSPYLQHGSSATSNNANLLAGKLQYIVQSHGLHRYYDAARLQAVLQKLATIDFAKIAAQWKIGQELAYDLAPLALYDIVFYCDDSGSMAFEENGDRINDLRFILSKVSAIATLFDDDGIVVRFMNSSVCGDGVRTAADVEMLMAQVRFSGATPLGTNLDRKVIQPLVLGQAMGSSPAMAKPVLVVVITDGEPYGESRDTIVQVIRRAKDALARTSYGSGALAVQIAQVGKDAKTQRFLEALDKDPLVGDMIDCTSYYEMEEEEFGRKGVVLTPELWLLKMCVGAIDPEYDAKDD